MRKLLFTLLFLSSIAFAQFTMVAPASTSMDVFVMGGSDFVRPGNLPRVNLNIGIGHTFDFLNKDPFGDEVTFAYTYENGGSHGFFHTKYGAHTVTLGIMKNFNLLKNVIVKKGGDWDKVTFYTNPMIGNTTLTGNERLKRLHDNGGPSKATYSQFLENRLYLGVAGGIAIHINRHNSIWVQEMLNKVMSFPWYTTSSVGYVFSF
jgi:hypothetical protein